MSRVASTVSDRFPRPLAGPTVALTLAAIALGVPSARAIAPTETDARKIMVAIESRARGDKAVSRMKMTIIDSAGRERVRTVASRSLEFPGGKKQLLIFESPADVRNTGLLSVDHDDGAKEDDQWLYLPSLRKTTRIAGGDKSGSFMGSDLTYADMTKNDPNDYDYSLVEASAKVGGEDCWVVESKPRNDRVQKETGYVKGQLWISKSKLMLLQAKMWVRSGRKTKLMKFADIRQVSGIWTPHKIMARTLRGDQVQSTTILEFTDLRYGDASVKDEDFSQRRLEQGL